MDTFTFFLVASAISLLVVGVSAALAPNLGIVDIPSGHKTHTSPVPYVGGFGVMAALLYFVLLDWNSLRTIPEQELLVFLICGLVLFATGLADDRWNLSFRFRLLIQSSAALAMIWGAEVVLTDLGELFPGARATLGMFCLPVTVLGMLSVTNALNMIDGIDGLAGSLSFVSLALLGVAAYAGGVHGPFFLILALGGGLLGFLAFNMRFLGRRRAHVYLGDNGSMLVGFVLGWLFIEMSQGENALMKPVAALYFFSMPLFDSATTISRRIRFGKSPFAPDRTHFHHLLLAAGASVETTVSLIVLIHLSIGLLGLAGLYFGVPEWLLFHAYLLLFLVFFCVVSRVRRFVPMMCQILPPGVTLKHGTGVFVGHIAKEDLNAVLASISKVVKPGVKIRVHEASNPALAQRSVFLVVDLGSWYEVRPTISRLNRRLSMDYAFEIRQYVERIDDNDQCHNSYRTQENSVDLNTETQALLASVVQADTELESKKAERSELERRFTPSYPGFHDLDNKIHLLQQRRAELESAVAKLPDSQQRILQLNRDVEVTTQLYTELLKTAQQLRVAKAGTVGNVRVIDEAAVGFDPIAPRKARILAVALVLGVLTGLMLIWLIRNLRVTVEDAENIERNLGLPVYATVPHSKLEVKESKAAKQRRSKVNLLAVAHEDDDAIESLRSLRTALRFAVAEAGAAGVMVTGPSLGVGKSFVSKNLAILLAQTGESVVLVDADMRRGHLHRDFGLSRDPGLSEYLSQDLQSVDVIRSTLVDGLEIVTCGTRPPKVSELLMSPRFELLIEALKQRFKHVIIDAPPILAVSDAASLGRYAGVTMMVVRAGQHPIQEIEQAVKRLSLAGIRTSGFVLNDLDTTRLRYRYGYSGYHYQYKYK